MKHSFIIAVLLASLTSIPASPSEKVNKIITDFTKFNTKLVSGANLVSKTVYAENGHSVLEFKYTDCKQGDYHLEFWICPAKHKDGTFEEYNIRVNNIPQNVKLKPTKADWHSIELEGGKTVTLNDGENTIQVISNNKYVPNVEVIEVSPASDPIHIDPGKYNAFRSQIGISDSQFEKGNKAKAYSLSKNTLNQIEYVQTECYDCYKNYPFTYTFHTSQYLDKGELFEILTEQLDDFETIIYFFKTDDPEKYSWAIYPDENKKENPDDEAEDEYPTTEFKINVPVAGSYTILLKPLYRNESGFCNILVNQDVYYENVAVTGNPIFRKFNTDQEYNTFTYAYSGDPMLWIENIKTAENPSGEVTKIEAACDDGDGAENEDDESEWGVNARIKKQYDSTSKYIWLTNYNSLQPNGTCYLYLNCKNAKGVLPYFQYLDPYDAILSGNATSTYNCISWSGGITSYWEWPGLPDSQFYSEDTLEAFDNFYDSRGLTREGANYSNAIVALWALVDKNGNRDYKHATITNGDGKLHGYSWESKAGSLERFFHPRDAVRGNNPFTGYGQIVELYRMKDGTFNSPRDAKTASLYYPELIGIDFDSDELATLKELINDIDNKTKQEFESLYAEFSDNVKGSIHSNPDILRDCQEFKELMSYYNTHPECKFIVFDLLKDNELPAILIFDKLGEIDGTLNKIRRNAIALKKAKGINKSNTYSPIQCNMMRNVKEYLKTLSSDFDIYEQQPKLEDNLNVTVESGQIVIESYNGYETNEPINIQIFDQYGNLIESRNNILLTANNKYIVSDIISNYKGIVILKISTADKIFTKKFNL